MFIQLNLDQAKFADKSNKDEAHRDYFVSNLKAGKLVKPTNFSAFVYSIGNELLFSLSNLLHKFRNFFKTWSACAAGEFKKY